MSTDLIPVQTQPYELTVSPNRFEVVAQTRTAVLEFINRQLKHQHDYGKIPGCGDKNVLFQPGMQKIMSLMQVYADNERYIADLGGGHREYTIKTRLKHIRPDGIEITVATGDGSCSTMESKYRYRGNAKRTCPACGSATIIKTSRNQYWCPPDKGGCNGNFPLDHPSLQSAPIDKVENPDIADVYNTVLKMAIKRATMAAVLNLSGGWGDHFDQADTDEPAPPPKQNNRKTQPKQGQQPDNGITTEMIRDEYRKWPDKAKAVFDKHLAYLKSEGTAEDDAVFQAYREVLST